LALKLYGKMPKEFLLDREQLILRLWRSPEMWKLPPWPSTTRPSNAGSGSTQPSAKGADGETFHQIERQAPQSSDLGAAAHLGLRHNLRIGPTQLPDRQIEPAIHGHG